MSLASAIVVDHVYPQVHYITVSDTQASNDNLDPSKDRTFVRRGTTDVGTSENGGGTSLNLDYVERSFPASGQVKSEIFDDTSSSFQYDSNWTPLDIAGKDWYEDTSHTTTVQDAMATFSFSGSSIELRGSNCPQAGNYTVVLDDGPEQEFQAYDASGYYRQVPLFTASSLDEGQHTLIFRNKPTYQNTGSWIDYAVVNSTIPNPTISTTIRTTSSATTLTTNSTSSSSSPSTMNLPSSGEALTLARVSTSRNPPTSEIGLAAGGSSASGSASASVPPRLTSSVTYSSGSPHFRDPTDSAGSEAGTAGASQKNGTSVGVVVGVAVGLAVAIGALLLVLFLWRERRKDNEAGTHAETDGWEDDLVVEYGFPREKSFIAAWRRRRDTRGRL